ncbi:hypothetical protein NPIL_372661 [Nephila pilipes]|uniref:Uncharacterized protein n=1 Tax=Nephila pilipes TaxID=299642 RepID=A0A8X6QKM1_NEPPI|nr:hypothetical protein NPIL_372661 [Nephila pilipes]
MDLQRRSCMLECYLWKVKMDSIRNCLPWKAASKAIERRFRRSRITRRKWHAVSLRRAMLPESCTGRCSEMREINALARSPLHPRMAAPRSDAPQQADQHAPCECRGESAPQ